jgi:hypothetical protein
MSHSTTFGRRTAVVVLSLVLAVGGVSACGDDGSVAGDAAATTTLDADATTEPTGDTPSASSGSFCIDIAAFDRVLDSLDDVYDSEDPEDLARGFGSVLGPMRAIDAPQEIKDDWATMVAAFTGLSQALDGIDVSSNDAEEQSAAVFEALEEEFEGVDAAADRVEDYVLAECDVDLGG